jgi:hypothetical protein
VIYRAVMQTMPTTPARVTGRVLMRSLTVPPAEITDEDYTSLSAFTFDTMGEAGRYVLQFVDDYHGHEWATVSPAPPVRVDWVIDHGATSRIPPTTQAQRPTTVTAEVIP